MRLKCSLEISAFRWGCTDVMYIVCIFFLLGAALLFLRLFGVVTILYGPSALATEEI